MSNIVVLKPYVGGEMFMSVKRCGSLVSFSQYVRDVESCLPCCLSFPVLSGKTHWSSNQPSLCILTLHVCCMLPFAGVMTQTTLPVWKMITNEGKRKYNRWVTRVQWTSHVEKTVSICLFFISFQFSESCFSKPYIPTVQLCFMDQGIVCWKSGFSSDLSNLMVL